MMVRKRILAGALSALILLPAVPAFADDQKLKVT